MKKDFYLVALIGFLVGWLIFLPAKNLGFAITPGFLFAVVLGFTAFAPIALFILKKLSRFWPVLEQFGKFAAVGVLNTLLDLGILNLLILLTDVSTGVYFSLFKATSFIASSTNSYFWNKFWTFQSKAPVNVKEYSQFIFFTGVGLLINVSVASLVVNLGGGFIANSKLLANAGALLAVFVALFWNFTSYRFLVFKGSVQKSEPKGE